jgi:hypothetical protein
MHSLAGSLVQFASTSFQGAAGQRRVAQILQENRRKRSSFLGRSLNWVMPEPLTLTLVSVTAISVAVCVYKSIDRVVSAPRETVRQAGQTVEQFIQAFAGELRKVFGTEPRISVERRVIQSGGQALRELALYKETVLIREEWVNTSWKSTKRLQVYQPFTVKAGFDLNRLKFEVNPQSREVTVTLSESTIVSVEYAGDYEVVKEEHGLWNRISASDRDAIVNSLPQKAQQEAERLGLRDKAAEQLKLFLQPMLPRGYSLKLRCLDDTLLFQTGKTLDSVPSGALSRLGLEESERRAASGA